MLFAYFGPETVLPVTSVLAAVIGFLMMAGRQTWATARQIVRKAAGFMGLPGGAPAVAPGRPAGRRPRAVAAEETVGNSGR